MPKWKLSIARALDTHILYRLQRQGLSLYISAWTIVCLLGWSVGGTCLIYGKLMTIFPTFNRLIRLRHHCSAPEAKLQCTEIGVSNVFAYWILTILIVIIVLCIPGSALKTRHNNIVLVPVLFRGIKATLTKYWDQFYVVPPRFQRRSLSATWMRQS